MSTDSIDGRLRPTRVIIGALCMGLVMFGAVVAWLVKRGGIPVASGDVVTVLPWVAKGLLFLGVLLGWTLWKRSEGQAKSLASVLNEEQARDVLAPCFQTGIILRAALVEGPGLLCIVTALLTRDLWMLAWGGVAVAGLIAIFPTRGTYERFVRDARGVGESGGTRA